MPDSRFGFPECEDGDIREVLDGVSSKEGTSGSNVLKTRGESVSDIEASRSTCPDDFSVPESLIEVEVTELMGRRNSVAELYECMRFLLRRFDTLSLSECVTAMQFAHTIEHRHVPQKAWGSLVACLSDRVNFLLANETALPNCDKSRFVRYVSEHHNTTQNIIPALRATLDTSDSGFFIIHLKDFHRLRYISELHVHFKPHLASVYRERRSLSDTCMLLDIVLATLPSTEAQVMVNELVSAASEMFETFPHERLAFFIILKSLLKKDLQYVWANKDLRALLLIIVGRGLYPRKGKGVGSRVHLSLAVAAARLGDLSFLSSRNMHDVISRALLFDSDGEDDLIHQIEICKAFKVLAVSSLDARDFFARLVGKAQDNPRLLVHYADLMRFDPSTKCNFWNDCCEKIISNAEKLSLEDQVKFMVTVIDAESCSEAVKEPIVRAMKSLVLFKIRRSEFVSPEIFTLLNNTDEQIKIEASRKVRE